MPKKKVEQEDDGPIEKRVMGGVLNNQIYELVFDGSAYQFAIGYLQKDGHVDLSQVWEVEDWDENQSKDIKIRPWQSDLILKGTVQVPTKYEKYNTKTQLYQDTLDFLKKYVDLPERENKINMHYVALSWLYDRLGELPYRRFLGNYGTGKSRALTAMLMLCLRGTIIKASATQAAIFRVVEQVKGTLCIDELNLSGGVMSEMFTAIESILCAGYEKNSPVLRCVSGEGEKGYTVEAFQTFGPKVLSTRQRFKDRALESRCLTAHTYRTKKKTIPVSLGEEFYQEATHLRNQWLTFRLANYWKPLKEAKAILELYNVEPRIRQIVAPLTRVAYRDYDFFVKYAEDQQEEAVILRQESWEGMVLAGIYEYIGTKEEDIPVSEVNIKMLQKDAQWNAKRTAAVLKSLGFRKYQRSIGSGESRQRPTFIKLTGKWYKVYLQALEEYYIIDNNGEPEVQRTLNSGTDDTDGTDGRDVPPTVIWNCPLPECNHIAGSQDLLDLHLRTKHRFKGDDKENVESNK
jgi:hypothetical protein